MNKISKLLNSTLFYATFLILSVIAAILFRSCRSNWVFIGTSVGFNPLALILLALMVVSSAFYAILLVLKLNRGLCPVKKQSALLIITAFLSSILIIFSLIYSIGLAASESSEVFILHLKTTLSEGALLIAVPFLALIYPKLSCKSKKAVALACVSAVLLFGINAFYPLNPYKITSQPTVIDNGKEYSIVFSTNDYGTAWAEYTFEGKDYKVYDHTGGRLNSDKKIHSISVPYEHLRNNSYKVASTRVIEEFSYGSRTGKTVSSTEYNFTYNFSNNQTWLVISDWHTQVDKASQSINNLSSDYDGVILLGDASPGVDFEEQVITNTVQFGGRVSGGTKPVIYVRGNHETRGAYAKDLPVALGLEQLYYTAEIGPYTFVVLDSGEDKDDSHIEYGGMTDYNTYRADMIEWLKGVEISNNKVIALSHAWQISAVEPELSQAGWAELGRLGTRLIISGHEHQCRFLGENDSTEKELTEKYGIIGYIDGGKVKESYVASLLTLNENGFEIYAIDNNGNVFVNENFEW